MFIKNGNSLFGKTGIIVSIIILLFLVLMSYSKCYAFTNMNSIDNKTRNAKNTRNINKEKFNNEMGMMSPPKNVRINIKGNDIIVDFTFDYGAGVQIPNSFMVLLVQYDNKIKPTGELKLFRSSEYDVNSTVTINEQSYNNNLCVLNNDKPACKYTIKNLDITDNSGNLFFYKLGIMAIYDTGNSEIITPYNVSTQNSVFSLDTSINQQNKIFDDFEKYKQDQIKMKTNSGSYSETIATADGQYELIKSQLGDYPSNLLLDTSNKNPTLLNELVDKSMALGILNIDVNVSNPNPTNT